MAITSEVPQDPTQDSGHGDHRDRRDDQDQQSDRAENKRSHRERLHRFVPEWLVDAVDPSNEEVRANAIEHAGRIVQENPAEKTQATLGALRTFLDRVRSLQIEPGAFHLIGTRTERQGPGWKDLFPTESTVRYYVGNVGGKNYLFIPSGSRVGEYRRYYLAQVGEKPQRLFHDNFATPPRLEEVTIISEPTIVRNTVFLVNKDGKMEQKDVVHSTKALDVTALTGESVATLTALHISALDAVSSNTTEVQPVASAQVAEVIKRYAEAASSLQQFEAKVAELEQAGGLDMLELHAELEAIVAEKQARLDDPDNDSKLQANVAKEIETRVRSFLEMEDDQSDSFQRDYKQILATTIEDWKNQSDELALHQKLSDLGREFQRMNFFERVLARRKLRQANSPGRDIPLLLSDIRSWLEIVDQRLAITSREANDFAKKLQKPELRSRSEFREPDGVSEVYPFSKLTLEDVVAHAFRRIQLKGQVQGQYLGDKEWIIDPDSIRDALREATVVDLSEKYSEARNVGVAQLEEQNANGFYRYLPDFTYVPGLSGLAGAIEFLDRKLFETQEALPTLDEFETALRGLEPSVMQEALEVLVALGMPSGIESIRARIRPVSEAREQ